MPTPPRPRKQHESKRPSAGREGKPPKPRHGGRWVNDGADTRVSPPVAVAFLAAVNGQQQRVQAGGQSHSKRARVTLAAAAAGGRRTARLSRGRSLWRHRSRGSMPTPRAASYPLRASVPWRTSGQDVPWPAQKTPPFPSRGRIPFFRAGCPCVSKAVS